MVYVNMVNVIMVNVLMVNVILNPYMISNLNMIKLM
jgi:hypothetical protein